MDLDSITGTLTDQFNALDMPIFTLAAAALAAGCVMATTPKSLKPVAFGYLVAMAAVIAMHKMQYLYWGIGGGYATAFVFYSLGFGRAKKA